MNAGAIMGKNAAPDALVSFRRGNARQGEPENEVAARDPALPDRRSGASLLFQGFPELRRETTTGLDLRGRFGLPGLEQMPEEPERKLPALPSRHPAGPMPPRAAAFMTHEAVRAADVELVESQPVDRQPGRDMPGRADQ